MKAVLCTQPFLAGTGLGRLAPGEEALERVAEASCAAVGRAVEASA